MVERRFPIEPPPIRAGKSDWYSWGYAMGAASETSPKSTFWNQKCWMEEQGTAPIDEFCPHGQPGNKTEEGVIAEVNAVLENGIWEWVIKYEQVSQPQRV